MKTTDISVRVARFRDRAKGGGSSVQPEARHAAIASAVSKRLRNHPRPATQAPATAAAVHAAHAAHLARVVAVRKRFARTHGG